MHEKSTYELEQVLACTHMSEFDKFIHSNKLSLQNESNDFYSYMKGIFKEKKLTQQMIYLRADIPEGYGYKLLCGEKRTKQRDVILRICYAAEFTLEEVQRALKKYRMAQLYVKIPRDALLMIAFNEHSGDINDVNKMLAGNGFAALKSCGTVE